LRELIFRPHKKRSQKLLRESLTQLGKECFCRLNLTK
jgi:hypothetical protein